MGAMLAGFGSQMLTQWGMNTSNRIGTGRSLRRQMAREQVEQTRLEAAAGIQGRVEGAKAAGLHPLVAMGSNVGGASLPVGQSFNSSVPDYLGAQVADREMKQRKEEMEWNRTQQQRESAKKDQADALAKMESEARIKLLTAQEAAERKRISDSDRDFLASQEALKLQAARNSNPLRVKTQPIQRDEDRVRPQYVPVRDRYGKIQYIPNPDVYDLELPSLVGAGTLALPEVQPTENRLQKWWNDVKRKDQRNREIRRALSDPNLPRPIPGT